jgi:hypothetical protein
LDKVVAILGCGPAGLLAAHGVALSGACPVIYAPKRKSQIGGAQYIHSDVQVEGVKPTKIRYVRLGTPEEYEEKIYGDALQGLEGLETSWHRFPDEADAWPMWKIYNALWDMYHDNILDHEIKPIELESMADAFDHVISTVPLPLLVPDAEYHSETVWVRDFATCPQDTIIYDGRPGVIAYRRSNLFGHSSTEVGDASMREYIETNGENSAFASAFRPLVKPLWSDATLPGIVLSGRYGRWQKGVLADESFRQAIELCGDAV